MNRCLRSDCSFRPAHPLLRGEQGPARLMTQCTDRVIGKILAGWRYDISGLAPEMRGDYEAHLAECELCRSRQRLHRGIDIGLMALASISMFVFLLAYGVIRYFKPSHAFLLELGALGGFLLSMLLWLLVAVATPAPLVVKDAALHRRPPRIGKASRRDSRPYSRRPEAKDFRPELGAAIRTHHVVLLHSFNHDPHPLV